MHIRPPSARRSEQRPEVDPHSGQIAHYGEGSTARAKKDAFSARDELPAPASRRGEQPAHHQEDRHRLHDESEGVVAQRSPQVAPDELPSRPRATAQGAPQPGEPMEGAEVWKPRGGSVSARRKMRPPGTEERAMRSPSPTRLPRAVRAPPR